jgi:isochorismate pyruvate lyase
VKRPDECTTMDELRASIDAIDDELLALLGRRAAHVERAIVLKERGQVPAAAPERYRTVMARVREGAEREGFPPELAARMWEEMVGYFISVERQVLDG